MQRQNLYAKDGRSRTTSIRVNPLLYDAVRQRGGSVEDILETALSAFLHVPSEVLVRLHEELDLLEHCYAEIREGREVVLAEELARLEGEKQDQLETDAIRRERLEAIHAETCSFPESGQRRVEMDIAAGRECVYEEKLVMILLKRLHYPGNTVREAERVEGAGGVGRMFSAEKNELFLFQIQDDFLNVSLENGNKFHCDVPDIGKIYFSIVMN